MKIFKFYFVIFAVLGLTSCSSDVNEKLLDTGSNSVLFKQSSLSGAEVGCEGGCDQAGKECTLSVNPDNGVAECTCEGSCSIFIIFDGIEKQLSNLNVLKSESFKDLSNYINKNKSIKSTSATVNLKKVEFETTDDGVHLAFFDYFDLETSEVKSVVWIDRSESKTLSKLLEEDKDKVIVDCSGPCDAEGLTCRERWNYNQGNVECTCQGGCKMTVTTVEEITPN